MGAVARGEPDEIAQGSCGSKGENLGEILRRPTGNGLENKLDIRVTRGKAVNVLVKTGLNPVRDILFRDHMGTDLGSFSACGGGSFTTAGGGGCGARRWGTRGHEGNTQRRGSYAGQECTPRETARNGLLVHTSSLGTAFMGYCHGLSKYCKLG
jgi:hypothetical protein